MTAPQLDIVAIGNAIVDVIAQADDAFIVSEGVDKGIDAAARRRQPAEGLYSRMGPGREISGGSAANTVAGMAMLGAKCWLQSAKWRTTSSARCSRTTSSANGHSCSTRRCAPARHPTARCLILVTPDAQRTMNTFLGASQYLPEAALDPDLIASGAIL